MGKVGSSSLETTLSKQFHGSVLHAHAFSHLPYAQQRHIRWRRRLRLPVYVISPVREPVARNISAFFHNFQRDTGHDLAARPWTVAELTELFLRHFPHNDCLEWFDAYLRPALGIDVLSDPFPIEQKWNTYRNGSLRLLVYRTDLEPAHQLDIVSGFLGVKLDAWSFANRAADKPYAAIYQDFCASAALPEVYLKLMYQSRYCRRFWSEAEIAVLRER
jgi:hypothetical protein